MYKALCFILLSTAGYFPVQSQLADTTISKELQIEDSLLFESVLSSEDSLNIFFLIDSLLQVEAMESISQLVLRIGYNSNVSSTGRTLGINEFGLSPGVAYYHKSGLYGDVSGYWSPEFDPTYYLTIGTIGYMNTYKNWSLIAEYNRFMYTKPNDPNSYTPYKNNLGLSNFYVLKPVMFRFDYYLYFGEKIGHRFMPGISVNFEKKNWSKLSRVLFYPSINVLFGSEEITSYIPYSNTFLGNIARLRQGLPLYYTEDNTVLGVMNYSFSLPLIVSVKKWGFSISYTYNIPKQLPGEELGLTNSGFMSFSISRFLNL